MRLFCLFEKFRNQYFFSVDDPAETKLERGKFNFSVAGLLLCWFIVLKESWAQEIQNAGGKHGNGLRKHVSFFLPTHTN